MSTIELCQCPHPYSSITIKGSLETLAIIRVGVVFIAVDTFSVITVLVWCHRNIIYFVFAALTHHIVIALISARWSQNMSKFIKGMNVFTKFPPNGRNSVNIVPEVAIGGGDGFGVVIASSVKKWLVITVYFYIIPIVWRSSIIYVFKVATTYERLRVNIGNAFVDYYALKTTTIPKQKAFYRSNSVRECNAY